MVEKAAGGLFAYFFTRVINRGQFRLNDPGDGVIVKANDRDIFGDAEAAFFECLEEHSGKEIICDKGAVGSDLHGEDLTGGADSGGFAEVVDDEQVIIEWQVIVGQRLFVTFQSSRIDIPSKVGGDVDDPAAALCRQVGGRFVACLYVIDYYTGAIGKFLDAIEEDDRDAFLYEGVEVVHFTGIEGEGGDQAVDAFVEKVVGVGGFFPVGLGGMANDQIVTGFCSDPLDPGKDRAYELALELMDYDADRIGLLHPQVAREAIGAVAHLLRGIRDPFAGFDIDGRMVF